MSRLLDLVADVPANIYARSMLLDGTAVIRGEAIVRTAEGPLAAVFGAPTVDEIKALLTESRWPLELVGPLDAADVMQRASGRKGVRSTVFAAPPGWTPNVSRHSVLADDPTVWAPPMGPLIQQQRIATAKLNDDIAAICIAAFATEKFWDVAIETPVKLRKRGFAADAFNLLAKTQLKHGRTPVWNAPSNNAGANTLAKKLGLVPAAELFYIP